MANSELEELSKAVDEIWKVSEKTPLDPFPIHFEVVPASIMYEVGSYGLPGRFSHWTHGRAYHQMKTMYDYGLSKIYELIINTNPAQAFLMEANSLIQNKLVIAHVIGHCFAPGTQIVTDAGFKAIESVQPGERVLNRLGEWVEARPTSRPYRGPLIQVLAGGQTCPMTPEHRLLALQPDKGARGRDGWLPYLKDAEPAWVRAQDLSAGDFLVARIPRVGRGTCATVSIPHVPYEGRQAVRARPEWEFPLNEETGELIGFFLAEGYVLARGLIGFGFSTEETGYHQRVRELVVRYWEVNVGEDVVPETHSHTVRCCSKQIAHWLIQEFGQHDPSRHLPQRVLEEAPEEFLRGVLRGYMNGDGTRGKYQLSYETSSPHLAQQVQQIALHFGIYLGLYQRTREGRLPIYCGTASGENMRALRSLLGWGPPDPAVRGGTPNRTWSLSHRVGDYFFIPVTRVEVTEYQGSVYCLNVPGDSSFLLANHVVSHNSDFFKNNVYFQHTSRQMVESVAMNAERIRHYEFEHGALEVEKYLDAVLAIEEHIDPNLRVRKADETAEKERKHVLRGRTTAYDDLWDLEKREPEPLPPGTKFPPDPEKDLLLFLIRYAPQLEDWQRDLISIVRAEMQYFLPQMQTKICNEGWACATSDSLLATENGFVRFDDLYERREAIRVGSGASGALHSITDFHKELQVPTLRITTRRGYTIEGALKHRVQMQDGSWRFLSEIQPGDRVALACGTDVWAREPVPLHYSPAERDASLTDVADAAGTSLWTVIRHRAGEPTRSGAAIEQALESTGYTAGREGKLLGTRHPLSLPACLNEPLAHLLGSFVGDGNVTKSGICITCGDEAYAHRLADLAGTSLGIPVSLRDDRTATGPRWRIEIHSRELLRLLETLGIDLDARAAAKQIPDAVLRSPKAVISAFLSGYFDADAYAGERGIILSSASKEMVRTVQIILLNYGILSTQRPKPDGCTHLEIRGPSAGRFRDEIGFKLERKQAALDAYLGNHQWYKAEEPVDEIVSIDPGGADVFDITVDVAHAYVANGFVNHNSFWHTRILREMDLSDDEHMEYMRLHAGVLSPPPRGRSINPYYVGFKIFEDIERRWNGDLTEKERKEYRERHNGQEWPYKDQGWEKMLEVRETESDLSFLRNFLTAQLVEDLDLYVYRREGDEWVIVEKDWRKVRDVITQSMTNFGFPYIVVEDGDYRRNRELYLKHRYDGQELDLAHAQKTLHHLYLLWGRPVHLETVVKEKPAVLSFDGEKDEFVTDGS